MVSVKEAAAKALEFARDVYGNEAIQAPRIDEVERDDSDWQITVSWLQRQDTTGMSLMETLDRLPANRIYKRFVVGVENGEVKAMRIRQVE